MPQQACHLLNRGVIRIGGDDRRAFLQGLISNDINLCVGDKMLYAALLTPQGKFLHDLFLADLGDHFLVDCEAERADDLIARLKKYKLRSKVTIEDARDEFDVWAVWEKENSLSSSFRRTPESRHTINQIMPNEPLDPDFRRDDALIYTDPRLPELGQRVIMKKSEKPEAEIVAFENYDRHRIMQSVPDGSRDMIVEKSTLLEGNFDRFNGISWTKGCYMGQELTARMHYRALVKKRLFTLKIEGHAPSTGSIIKSGDFEVGEMRSSCGDVGLALLAVEKINLFLQIEDSSTTLTVIPAKAEIHT